jgi:superfamily II DNA/RNA helicase
MPYHTQRRPASFSRRPSAHRAQPKRRSFSKKDYIDPARFIKAARMVEQEVYQPTNGFDDFAVDQLIKSNLLTRGFTTPTPIQDQTIPQGLDGADIVGIANTGTGKTIAFAVPVIQRLLTNKDSRAIIMAPTRELAQQIEAEVRMVAKGSGLYGALLIGGTAMGPQLGDLRRDPRIVIGTPGRIKDHAERGTLKLAKFDTVVLDEVDRMLDMGFITDMTIILKQLADKRQSFFFSATMDYKVKALISTFVQDPVHISVKHGDTSDNVEQNVIKYIAKTDKIEKLHELLIQEQVTKVLIFDETQRNVERLCHELEGRGFDVDAIHGGKNQSQRQRALNRFKKSEISVLVATDVAARGIDVADITHVVNYATPQSYSDYVHRIGRAGRAGRKGYALTFIEGYDRNQK